jgi:hypothetical protein
MNNQTSLSNMSITTATAHMISGLSHLPKMEKDLLLSGATPGAIVQICTKARTSTLMPALACPAAGLVPVSPATHNVALTKQIDRLRSGELDTLELDISCRAYGAELRAVGVNVLQYEIRTFGKCTARSSNWGNIKRAYHELLAAIVDCPSYDEEKKLEFASGTKLIVTLGSKA